MWFELRFGFRVLGWLELYRAFLRFVCFWGIRVLKFRGERLRGFRILSFFFFVGSGRFVLF